MKISKSLAALALFLMTSACASTGARASLPSPKGTVQAGMSVSDVRDILGLPLRVDRTKTAYGVREQWYYGGAMYLNFDEGILKTISQ